MPIRKTVITLIALYLLTGMAGCLTFRTMRVDISFNDDFKSGRIGVVYSGLNSTESDPEKQFNDFEELRKAVEEPGFLLDAMDEGIYVKSVELRKEQDELIGSYSGYFRDLKSDGHALMVREEERSLVVAKDEGCIIKTNGRIEEAGKTYTIIWPVTATRLWYEISCTSDEPVYPLLSYYDAWQQGKK